MYWTKHFKQKLTDCVRFKDFVVNSLNDLRLRNTNKNWSTLMSITWQKPAILKSTRFSLVWRLQKIYLYFTLIRDWDFFLSFFLIVVARTHSLLYIRQLYVCIYLLSGAGWWSRTVTWVNGNRSWDFLRSMGYCSLRRARIAPGDLLFDRTRPNT